MSVIFCQVNYVTFLDVHIVVYDIWVENDIIGENLQAHVTPHDKTTIIGVKGAVVVEHNIATF